jgi:lysophospholipase L1-like esterase
MLFQPRTLPGLLLLCIGLITHTALGQSLSLVRKGETQFWLEAATPPGMPHVLQASGNLHLWVDIQDEVQGALSKQLDHTRAAQRYFRLSPWAPPAPPITVMLIGDSTVADFISNNSWFNGWGQGIYGYFKSNVQVVNLAYPGYSSKVFLTSAEKIKVLVIKPDYVLIQFGLLDEFSNYEAQRTTLPEFEENLKTIVELIRGFDGIPILMTPPASRFWDAQGRITPLYQNRFAVIKSVAAELQTPLIDLNRLTTDLYNQLGKTGCADLQWGDDYLHFTDKGSLLVAGLVVNAVPDSLGPYLTGIFNPFLTPQSAQGASLNQTTPEQGYAHCAHEPQNAQVVGNQGRHFEVHGQD